MKTLDEFYMQRCLQLAKNGMGTTYPNPLVGAVIVHRKKIIGEGWHYQSGKPHAEINAINSTINKSLLKESTLYVNLEPCSHYGKTPPCALAIIKNEIPNVVIGTRDFATHVNGRGIQMLKQQGIMVTENVLKSECMDINRRFFTFHQKKRPYIILKWAETANAFFAPSLPSQKWITSHKMKFLNHLWRTQEQAILVGVNTLKIDNPKLDTRYFHGVPPIKISIGRSEKEIKHTHFYNDKNHIFLNAKEKNLEEQMELLKRENIQSILVEGGIITLQSFINAGLWDEARIIRSKTNWWKEGRKSPTLSNEVLVDLLDFEEDTVFIFKHNKRD